ncbi:TetR/AcrR family transcriptional regulator [Rhizobium deserti]|uniref:TetR/AcrR family transcriptional regulator n=1 Tax=Rhizobium deserti TaxID=2547961 RepID=A0A4R5UN69_9HYPH|nr:TetR/AcrR family transcriptional regulator [Rhizobium deserti]TDK39208.1 TetR/AcrR family transcriptional regulator [Rhizobium deserti]
MKQSSERTEKCRGRPPVRPPSETKRVIVAAAAEQFRQDGYASASVARIARSAGVSTKTLYRLFPAKSDLFAEVISQQIGRYFLPLEERELARMSTREGLEHLLTAYGRLTLSEETIFMTRLVLAESDRFPELAAVFYEQAVRRTSATIEAWLARQVAAETLQLDNVPEAAGILRGMMAMEPQRAAMLGCAPALSEEDVADRARRCTRIFLDGSVSRTRARSSGLPF